LLSCKDVLESSTDAKGQFQKLTVSNDAAWAAAIGWLLISIMLFWRRRNKGRIGSDATESDEFDNPNTTSKQTLPGGYGSHYSNVGEEAVPAPPSQAAAPIYDEPPAASSDPFAGVREATDNPFAPTADDPNNPFQ